MDILNASRRLRFQEAGSILSVAMVILIAGSYSSRSR